MNKKGEVLKVVLPGDVAFKLDPNAKSAVFVGPGLRRQCGEVLATRSGVLKRSNKNVYFVDSHEKRYIPQQGEFVIGIITRKKGENYLINICGSEHAVLSPLCFENESRRARNDLKIGELIYGQLLTASRDEEPEIVIIDVVNNNVGIAALPDNGLIFNVPLHVARLIANPNRFLKVIAGFVDFNIIVGYNGRVWLYSDKLNDMVGIMHCVMLLEVINMDLAINNIKDTFTAYSS